MYRHNSAHRQLNRIPPLGHTEDGVTQYDGELDRSMKNETAKKGNLRYYVENPSFLSYKINNFAKNGSISIFFIFLTYIGYILQM